MSFYFTRAYRSIKKTIGTVQKMKKDSDDYVQKSQNNESLKNNFKNIDNNPFYWIYKAKVYSKDKANNIFKKANQEKLNLDKSKRANNTNVEKFSSTMNKVNSLFYEFIIS